jgi:pimeloyl-ACP methyl ester carboxylesterase
MSGVALFEAVRGLVGVASADGARVRAGRMSLGVITTAEGRDLAYEQAGDLEGAPVFVLHGTPGCRLSGRHPDESRVSAAGLRIVTYDRPGYGRSSRHRGRRVVDCVSDVAAIADELGLERFAVMGGSGGGPHALAVGARLAERVTRVWCDVGVAPYDAVDLDWLAGMDPSNVKELGWALAGEDTLVGELERETQKALDQVADDPAALLDDFELSASDRAVLADEGVRQTLRASVVEMFANGVWGWVDDDLVLIRPWGFEVQELEVPVEIRYGVSDVLVPAAHGEWLATHIAHAEVTIDEQGGHLSTPDQRLDKLRALATA